MGILGDIVGRVKSDLTYSAGSKISDSIEKGAKGLVKKGGKCPQCKAKITESGLKFCKQCGYNLITTCTECQINYPISTNVCGKCGKRLPKPKPIDKNWKKKLK